MSVGPIAQATPSSEDEFHSSDEKEDLWVHQKDIGVGGFGIVKLFVNKVLLIKSCSFLGCVCSGCWPGQGGRPALSCVMKCPCHTPNEKEL